MGKRFLILIGILLCSVKANSLTPKQPFPIIQWDHPLSQGLILCSAFHTGSGTDVRNLVTFDSSDGLLNGTTIQWGNNQYGYDLLVTSSDTASFVNYSATRYDFERTDKFSFEFLIFINSTSQRFVNIGNCGGTAIACNNGIFLDINPTSHAGAIRADFRNTGGTNEIDVRTPDNSFTANTWNDILVTYAGTSAASGVHVYLNGKDLALTINVNNLSASLKTGSNWRLNVSGVFKALVAQSGIRYGKFAIWNRVLSSTEASLLASNPFQMLDVK